MQKIMYAMYEDSIKKINFFTIHLTNEAVRKQKITKYYTECLTLCLFISNSYLFVYKMCRILLQVEAYMCIFFRYLYKHYY